MKVILKYIGYFMAVVGFAGVIWKVSVSVNGNDNNITSLKSDVKDIKEIVMPLKEQNDSIIFKVEILNRKVERVGKSQEALKGKFIQHMGQDSSVTKQDIIDLMNDLEVKKKADTIKHSIIIEKIK